VEKSQNICNREWNKHERIHRESSQGEAGERKNEKNYLKEAENNGNEMGNQIWAMVEDSCGIS